MHVEHRRGGRPAGHWGAPNRDMAFPLPDRHSTLTVVTIPTLVWPASWGGYQQQLQGTYTRTRPQSPFPLRRVPAAWPWPPRWRALGSTGRAWPSPAPRAPATTTCCRPLSEGIGVATRTTPTTSNAPARDDGNLDLSLDTTISKTKIPIHITLNTIVKKSPHRHILENQRNRKLYRKIFFNNVGNQKYN